MRTPVAPVADEPSTNPIGDVVRLVEGLSQLARLYVVSTAVVMLTIWTLGAEPWGRWPPPLRTLLEHWVNATGAIALWLVFQTVGTVLVVVLVGAAVVMWWPPRIIDKSKDVIDGT